MVLEASSIAKTVCGSLSGDGDSLFSHFSTDSREIEEGSFFIALKGKKTDGHLYCEDAFRKGARGALLDRRVGIFPVEIVVNNSLESLINLGKYLANDSPVFTIGVCGSSGKTTTKEMVKEVLKNKYRVSATPGNMNTEIGIPLYLLNEDPKKDIRVVEYGTQKVGDAQVLLDIIKPNGVVVTTLGPSHIEHFGSLEVMKEEEAGIMVKSIPSPGWVVINADNPFVKNLECSCTRITYGYEGVDFRLLKSIFRNGGTEVEAFTPEGRINFFLKYMLGEHSALNALGALAAGYLTGIEIGKGIKAVSDFQPLWGRMERKIIRGATVIVDYYNSNPLSLRVSLKVFKELEGGRKILVLGEMRELGTFSEKEHNEIAAIISEMKFDVLLTVGEKASIFLRGFPGGEHFSTAQEAGKRLKQLIQTGDLVLIKGSRGIGMEETEKELLE